MHSKNFKYILVTILLLSLTAFNVYSQIERRSRRDRRNESSIAVNDTIPAVTDTLTALDSLQTIKDSTARADSLSLLKKSSIDAPAFTSAQDSIIEDFTGNHRMIYYYGGVTVEYLNMKLSADYMDYDMNTGTVHARGTLDSLTGEWSGKPVMEQGQDKYEMDEVWYNFNTQKARINSMTTTEGEGTLYGKNIKMMPDRSINMTNGRYTVCDDAEHPHYYVNMSSAKVITQPSQKTVFGPANVVVEDISLPLAIPFGFIPKIPERATGILTPSFGEEAARGFYMRDAGLYFVLGDYLDVSMTGSLYSLGSWGVDLNSRYKVNYKFNGNVAVNYSVDQTGEKGGNDFFQSKNFGVRWSHTQDSKAHPGSSFTASVNFSSPSNSRYNSHSVNEALQNQASSSISYSHNFNGKANFSINALHSQNSRDSSYTFTLPNISFSISTFYPFKKKNRVGAEKLYEKISFGYNTSLQNKISFKISEFGQEGFTDKFKNGMTHSFNIGLPNFSIFKYININPSVNYGMNWFFRATEYVYDAELDKPVAKDLGLFSAFGITQNYSGSVSMDTRLYGMYNFGPHHRLQAIRHVISPSVSISYAPELGTAANGWRTFEYTDKNGELRTYDYNRFSGQLYSPPGKGQSANANFSIGNNLEAKIKDFADTTGTGVKKIKLIDQFTISGNYNFLADSLKLSNIGMTMSTTLFEKISFSGNLNFDPYAIDEYGKRINTFSVVKNGLGHILRLTNANASVSYSLSGNGELKGDDAGSSGSSGYQRIYYHPITGEYIPGGWVYYTNPVAPWSLSFNYSLSYSKSYSFANNQLNKKNNITQTLGVNGNIKLTPKMSINFNSGFDFMAMKLSTTQISAQYDLHCFNIAVSWVPTGKWQSYTFQIAANASALSDILKFKKSTSYWD